MRHGLRGWKSLLAFILVPGCVWLLGHAGEPGKGKPPDKARPPEQEETVRPKNKKLKDLDPDNVEERPAQPIERPASGSLAQIARTTTNKRAKELYLKLAMPHDVIIFRSSLREQRVKPIKVLIQDVRSLPADLELTPLEDDNQPGKPYKAIPTLEGYKPYEKVAVEAVRQYLADAPYKLPQNDPRHLSHMEQLTVAETALSAVARFHAAAREQGERDGDNWAVMAVDLREQLLDVHLQQFGVLGEAHRWNTALELARRLWNTYLLDEEQAKIARSVAGLLKQALKDPEASPDLLREWRQRLGELSPANPAQAEITASLKDQAQQLYALALAARDRKDEAKAQDLLQQAEDAWPNLPELRTLRQAMNANGGVVLRIGMRSLPKLMSPGLATTDSELRAVELLFESLVKVQLDPEDGALRYEPGLAVGRPQLIPLGRQFHLPRNAFWSNNQPLTLADVRHTVRLLKQGNATGLAPAWGNLLEDIRGEADPFRINVTLKQGYLEPLSLMTFKILPQPAVLDPELTKDPVAFARKPVGSGPFQYDGTRKVGERDCVVFKANPNYSSRPGKAGLPRIREIHFFECTNPLADLRARPRRLDMVLDLTGDQQADLEQQANALKIALPAPLPGNRRVYFLAVNHRQDALQNPDLRRALAHAINRERILELFFRPGQKRTFHKALNSLFPAKCWALDPRLHDKDDKESLDLHDPDQAKALAKQVLAKLKVPDIKFSLKYPKGDDKVKKAMESISSQVRTATGIQLELEVCDPNQLRKDVEETFNYELAYYHYDFPDDTFWLLPLLGQHGLEKGGNYLGYDGEVPLMLQGTKGLRDFVVVRDRTRAIHEKMVRHEMPVIPLWQLDPMLAVHQSVRPPLRYDPWLVFGDIEEWKLDRP